MSKLHFSIIACSGSCPLTVSLSTPPPFTPSRTESNTFKSASNLALNDHKAFVDEELKKQKNNHRLLVNEYGLVSQKFNSVSLTSSNLKERIQKSEIEVSKIIDRKNVELETVNKSVESVHRYRAKVDKTIKDLEIKLTSIKKDIKNILKEQELEKEQIKNKIEKSSKKLKDEILSLPSEIEAVKIKFMDELSMHKIDNEGLMKEIKVLKKTIFINEKKVEYLITMIERVLKD